MSERTCAKDPSWVVSATDALEFSAIETGDRVVFRRSGRLLAGTVIRRGLRVLDVESDWDGQPLVFRVRGDDFEEAPPCGHFPRVPGCGGCDPGAVEFVIEDSQLRWRRRSDVAGSHRPASIDHCPGAPDAAAS